MKPANIWEKRPKRHSSPSPSAVSISPHLNPVTKICPRNIFTGWPNSRMEENKNQNQINKQKNNQEIWSRKWKQTIVESWFNVWNSSRGNSSWKRLLKSRWVGWQGTSEGRYSTGKAALGITSCIVTFHCSNKNTTTSSNLSRVYFSLLFQRGVHGDRGAMTSSGCLRFEPGRDNQGRG